MPASDRGRGPDSSDDSSESLSALSSMASVARWCWLSRILLATETSGGNRQPSRRLSGQAHGRPEARRGRVIDVDDITAPLGRPARPRAASIRIRRMTFAATAKKCAGRPSRWHTRVAADSAVSGGVTFVGRQRPQRARDRCECLEQLNRSGHGGDAGRGRCERPSRRLCSLGPRPNHGRRTRGCHASSHANCTVAQVARAVLAKLIVFKATRLGSRLAGRRRVQFVPAPFIIAS